MITYREVEKLRSTRAPDESVLSVYVYVPPEPAKLRELQARTVTLITHATAVTPQLLRAEDAQAVTQVVAARGREYPGQTLGIFASRSLGLLEVVPLPGRFPERAVLAVRPHVRPLLAALQRHPDHRVVIIDHQHAWLLAAGADRIEVVARVPAENAQHRGLGGWFLEPSHLLERVTERAGHLYQDAAGILDRLARACGSQPVVIGGYADSITQLLSLLPAAVRQDYAGAFAADPHHLTLARAQALADPVIAHWAERRERELAETVITPPLGGSTAVGLDDCLDAVNAGSAELLLIGDEPVVPGVHCERCDALSVSSDGCCDWGVAARAVPDLLEEMSWRTLHDGGRVVSARMLPCPAAVRLR